MVEHAELVMEGVQQNWSTQAHAPPAAGVIISIDSMGIAQ